MSFLCDLQCLCPVSAAEDSGTVNRQVKEAESEAAVSAEEADTIRGTMDRVLSAWESYKHCLHSLQVFLGQAQTGHKVLNLQTQ